MTGFGVRRDKAALSSGCEARPATSLQPEAVGAGMELTQCPKPSITLDPIVNLSARATQSGRQELAQSGRKPPTPLAHLRSPSTLPALGEGGVWSWRKSGKTRRR